MKNKKEGKDSLQLPRCVRYMFFCGVITYVQISSAILFLLHPYIWSTVVIQHSVGLEKMSD